MIRNIFFHSGECLARRPRLGKNSADFSNQVAQAVDKCKVDKCKVQNVFDFDHSTFASGCLQVLWREEAVQVVQVVQVVAALWLTTQYLVETKWQLHKLAEAFHCPCLCSSIIQFKIWIIQTSERSFRILCRQHFASSLLRTSFRPRVNQLTLKL